MGLLNPQQPQQAQGRKASSEEQAQYKTLVMQVVKFMSMPENVEALKQATQQMGPEKALAMMIAQSLQLVGQAAKQSGVNVAMHTGSAALKEIVTVFASMMAASGIVQDVQQTVDAVVQMVMSGGKDSPQEERSEPQDNPQEEQQERMPPQEPQMQQQMGV